MRRFLLKTLAVLFVFASLPIVSTAEAATRRKRLPESSRMQEDKAYCLTDIMRAPKEYIQREVMFYCRFATTANLFKPTNTRFNENAHANFAVWADKAVLWDKEGRKNVLPTLYVPKNEPDGLEVLRTARKYELLAITGTVLNVYAGYPWILVTRIERVELDCDRLTETVVDHMKAGYDALAAGAGGASVRHFEQALKLGLPPEYRPKAYEQLACAYLLENRLGQARDYLRLATDQADCDALLHLALADVTLRMGDPEEALAHCEFALERSGRMPQVYGIMGESKAMLGDYVKAFTDLNIAAASPGISPREQAMVNVRRARVYARSGRMSDAARTYVAVSDPGAVLAGEGWLHNEIGLFYEKLYLEGGDARYLESAAMAYEEAARLDRLDANVLYNLAEVQFRRQALMGGGDYKPVREVLERINQVEPDFTPGRIVEGRVLYAEGKSREAEYNYQSVAGQIGEDALSLMALAEAYMDIGNTAGAANAAAAARTLAPWNKRVAALGKYLDGRMPPPAPTPVPVATSAPVLVPEPAYAPTAAPAPSGQAATPQYEIIQPRAIVSENTNATYRIIEAGSLGSWAADGEGGMIVDAPPVIVAPRASVEYQADTEPVTIIVPSSGWVDGNAEWSVESTPQAAVETFVPAEMAVAHPESAAEIRTSVQPVMESPGQPLPKAVIRGIPFGSATYRVVPDVEMERWVVEEGVSSARVSSSGAYASPVMRDERNMSEGHASASDEDVRPPKFSFSPDPSPVLISGFRSAGGDDRERPVRNANVYRGIGGAKRQPAEVTEHDPAVPGSAAGRDVSVMAPAGGGVVHRTEVNLPNMAKGIGMASDYH